MSHLKDRLHIDKLTVSVPNSKAFFLSEAADQIQAGLPFDEARSPYEMDHGYQVAISRVLNYLRDEARKAMHSYWEGE